MSYDKSVWTSEPLSGEGPRWYWGLDDVVGQPAPYPREVLTAQAFTEEHFPAFVRSIHPIPSAEEIAALVECEKAAKGLQVRLDAHFGGPKHSIDWLEQERLRAALARLDAARKERGA